MNKIIKYNRNEVDKIVDMLYALRTKCKVFTFNGPLGAGKTTLIKALLKKLGIRQMVTSPTFSYINVYENDQGQLFYHFDLYRISTLEDFLQQGFDEYLYLKESWAFIEWPSVVRPLLNKKVCHIIIDYDTENTRILKLDVSE